MSAMNYDGGLTISVQVSDLKRAVGWYQKTMGWNLLYQLDDMGWCELSTSTPKVNVGLSQVEQPKVGGPVPTWGVKDIEVARKRLESMDVRFDGKTREIPGMVKLATFFDPDGNAMMLYQSLMKEEAGS